MGFWDGASVPRVHHPASGLQPAGAESWEPSDTLGTPSGSLGAQLGLVKWEAAWQSCLAPAAGNGRVSEQGRELKSSAN